MSPIASNDQDYNLDTTGLSLAPSTEEESAVEITKVQSKSRELINDNQHIVDKRRFIRRVGTERRYEIRFDTEDRRHSRQDRRSCERHWQSGNRS